MTTTTADDPTTTSSATTRARRTPHPAVATLGLSAALSVILVLLLLVFIMPSLQSGPRDLAVGIVGTTQSAQAFEASLLETDPDAWVPERFTSEAELRRAIESREVVGGFVLDDDVHVLVASAGSQPIAAAVTAVGQALSGGDATVTDVVGMPEADPSGIGLGGLAFPLVFGGIVPVVAFRTIFPSRPRWRLGGVVGFAVVGGIIVAAVQTFVFGSVESNFWPVAGALALGIAALAVPLAGLQEVFGTKGFTAGAMVMMFLGNPLAGISTTGAWLPAGLGTFGQLLPPGAAGTLVRSTAYFDGAGGLAALLTLAAWILAGVLLHVAARRAAGSSETLDGP